MDNVLVCLMIITLISIVQSYNGISVGCFEKCQPGFHSNGRCEDSPHYFYCEKCGDYTFTAIENTHPRCERCRSCAAGEVEKKKCTSTSDTVCDCKDGFYKPDSDSSCQACKEYSDLNNPAWREKCQPCQRPECLNNPECKKKCKVTAPQASRYHPPATTTTTTSSSSSSSSTSSSSLTSSSSPTSSSTSVSTTVAREGVPWHSLVVVVALLVFFILVMIFYRKLLRETEKCFCWRENKKYSVEAPQRNEQCQLQGSSPTTLTLNITEESPMMGYSQNSTGSDPPGAHTSFPFPALNQEPQSENCPPIVLYAIINVVPLRRWKEFLRLLCVADQQLERVELEAGLGQGLIEKQYQMLKLWSQGSAASLRDVFSALHYMELSGCAQMLQENLETLPTKNTSKLPYRDPTDCELSEVVRDTNGAPQGYE